jgi:hypothetical protein
MTDPELARLAALWRRTDDSEQVLFEKMARKARLRARLIGLGDLVIFFLVIASLSLAVLRHRPTPTTVLLGAMLMAVVLWLNWRRRLHRKVARAIDTSRRQIFFETAIGSAKARLRTVTLGLYLFLPFLLLTALFLICVEEGIGLQAALAYLPIWAVSRRGMTVILIFLLPAAWSLHAGHRIRNEIGRLEALERAYEEEAGLEGRA